MYLSLRIKSSGLSWRDCCYRSCGLLPLIEVVLCLMFIMADKAVYIPVFEPAVIPGPQAISVDKSFIGPVSHRSITQKSHD